MILVVDDEPQVLAMGARILLDAGFEVRTAGDGAEALALASALPSPPTALVTDVRMAPVDGPSLARLLRRRYPATRVLFVSGYPADLDPGIDDAFLAKPYLPEQLLSALARLLA